MGVRVVMGTVAPFKIVHMVIKLISINVIYFSISVNVRNERSGNNSMNFVRFSLAVLA